MRTGWLVVTIVAALQASGVTPLPPQVDATLTRERAALIKMRRDLHRHPEVSGREERTAKIVADHLRRLGLTVRTGVGGHGVVGVLTGGRPGPLVAYRADMDAVPSSAPDPVDFASVVPGVRHICGHDLHVTIGLGLATALSEMRAQLAGRVMFIFQPAEERATGAQAMLDAGMFADDRPRVIFGLHTAPMPVGVVSSKSDRMMLATPVAPGVVNDAAWFARSRAAIVAVLGADAFSDLSAPPPGFSEDFGHFQTRVPGVFFFLGGSNAAKGLIAAPHSPGFALDDDAIGVGVRAMAAVLLDALK